MGVTQRPRVGPHDIRARTALLYDAACKVGDPFLQYLYQMTIIHLDELAGRPIRYDTVQSNFEDPNIALAATLIAHRDLQVLDGGDE
jgi:hypothetical protein